MVGNEVVQIKAAGDVGFEKTVGPVVQVGFEIAPAVLNMKRQIISSTEKVVIGKFCKNARGSLRVVIGGKPHHKRRLFNQIQLKFVRRRRAVQHQVDAAEQVCGDYIVETSLRLFKLKQLAFPNSEFAIDDKPFCFEEPVNFYFFDQPFRDKYVGCAAEFIKVDAVYFCKRQSLLAIAPSDLFDEISGFVGIDGALQQW